MEDEEDEFDAILQDAEIKTDNDDTKKDAVNYKVPMETYEKVDIFQTLTISTNGTTPEEKSEEDLSAELDRKEMEQQIPNDSTNRQQCCQSSSTENNDLTNGSLRRSQPEEDDVDEPSEQDRIEVEEDNKAATEAIQEDEDDVLWKLRDTSGGSRDDTMRAKAEWEAVGTIHPGNASTINATPVISFNETLAFFQRVNMQPYLSKIKPTVERSGFAALRHLLLGPPKVKVSLQDERNLIFAIAQCPFDDNEDVHRRVLQTIYKQLTGSVLDCPRYGNHWEQIGFQGTDPSTDLRGCGFLGLMTLLHFVMDPVRLQLAKEIYKLSQHEVQNFPFSVMSINMTRIALQSLREDSLSRECNRRKQVFGVINDYYAAIFLQLHQIWKQRQQTIKDSGFAIKEVETASRKNPREVIRILENYLNGRNNKTQRARTDKQGAARSPKSGGVVEFAGVHELEVEDNG